MEAEHGFSGMNLDGNPRVFFRGNRTTDQLINEARTTEFVPFEDDAVVYDAELDATTGCSDSCEAFTSEQEDDDPC